MSRTFRTVLRPPSAPISQDGRDRLGPAVRRDLDVDPVGMLHEAGELMAEAHLGVGLAPQDVELDRRQAMLLEVQAIGIRRDVGDEAEVELRDELAAQVADLPVPHLRGRSRACAP